MKLSTSDIYSILATIALIVAMWYIRHNDQSHEALRQKVQEELDDYKVFHGQEMLKIRLSRQQSDSTWGVYEQGKAATPDIGKAQDIVESVYLPERKKVIKLDANATVERMAWINKADSLLK